MLYRYWLGSLDFNVLGSQVGFSTQPPPKSEKHFLQGGALPKPRNHRAPGLHLLRALGRLEAWQRLGKICSRLTVFFLGTPKRGGVTHMLFFCLLYVFFRIVGVCSSRRPPKMAVPVMFFGTQKGCRASKSHTVQPSGPTNNQHQI